MAEKKNNTKPPKIHISNDGLEATIRFPMPDPGSGRVSYSRDMLIKILAEAGVTYGIDMEQIAVLSNEPIYERNIVIAKGIPCQESVPGHFEYMFDLTINKKPVIREDGTTDYMNIKAIEVVHKDEVIAVYHPAVRGIAGTTVRNTFIEPKPARDLPPLAGRGFERSADNLTYTSILDGKISMNGNRIIISPVHEVEGDANIESGNIDFNGDVVIHGGAKDGVIIKAAGSVTIHGLIENCEIYAGKEVYLLSGVKGGEKTIIESASAITAQYIEYAVVTCEGDITADYIFKSKVSCDGKLSLTGKKSSIIGGQVSAVKGIDVDEVGNDFGTITNVSAGIDTERLIAIDNMNKRVVALTDNVDKIKKGIESFDKLGLERGIDYKDDPRRMQLLRVKIRDEAIVVEEKAKLDKMKAVLANGEGATIRVFKKVFPGVNVTIDNHRAAINEEQERIEFVKSSAGIRMDKLTGVK